MDIESAAGVTASIISAAFVRDARRSTADSDIPGTTDTGFTTRVTLGFLATRAVFAAGLAVFVLFFTVIDFTTIGIFLRRTLDRRSNPYPADPDQLHQ